MYGGGVSQENTQTYFDLLPPSVIATVVLESIMAVARLWKVFMVIFLLASPCLSEQEEGREKNGNTKSSRGMSGTAKCAIAGTVAVGGAVLAAPFVLPAVGFTAGGVAAGSVAAAAQSSIGAVAAGSWFATLQSIGAAGLSWTAGATATGAGGVFGAIVGAVSDFCGDNGDKGKDSDSE